VILSCGLTGELSDASTRTCSIRNLYPDALRIAKGWEEDAYFVGAEALFSASGTTGYPPCTFSFRSPTTNVVGLFVVYDPAMGQFKSKWVSIAKEDPQHYPEIKESDWFIDSTEALKVAQEHSGAKFLSGRSANDLDLFLRLEKRWQQNEQFLTVWRVSYNDLSTGQSLNILVDALTGQVIP